MIHIPLKTKDTKRHWYHENEDGMIRVRLMTTDAKHNWYHENEDGISAYAS